MSDQHKAFWEGFNDPLPSKLTDSEESEIEQVMLTVTLDAFGEFSEEHDIRTMARRVVRAFAVAKQAYDAAREKITKTKPDVYIDIDPDDVVATAFNLWIGGLAAKGMPAHSLVGEQLLGFAQGMSAVRALHEAQCILDDDESAFSYSGEAAEILDRISPK